MTGRALRAALALLMLAQPVAADVLVLTQASGANAVEAAVYAEDEAQMRGLLSRSSERVVFQRAQNFPTEQVRTGITSVGTFQAVIHLLGSTSGSTCLDGGVCPDSLTLTPGLPTVPQLYVGLGSGGPWGGGTDSALSGAGDYQAATVPGATMYTPGTSLAFRTNSQSGMVLSTQTPDGGMRVLVAQNTNAAARYSRGSALPCVDCDSTRRTNGDTARVWVRLNRHKAGAAQNVFCVWAHDSRSESSPELMWLSVAYLDSITGRRVLGQNFRPVEIGFQIRGEGVAGLHVAMGGGPLADSTMKKAVRDSIAALDFPFSIGFPVDSLTLGTVPQRLGWWKAVPKAHFAPYSLTAIRDSTLGDTTGQRPVDQLGRYRKRAAYGDGSGLAADTSMWALIQRSYRLLGNAVGTSRVDHSWMPSQDDWSPVDLARMTPDSLYAFLELAGVKNVVANVRERTTNPAFNRLNPLGFYGHSRTETINLGPHAGREFRILATPGYCDSGSARFENGATASDGDKRWHSFDRENLFWNGITKGQTLVSRASTVGITRALPDSTDSPVQIYTIHAGDLGTGTHASGRPIRPGWWQLKNTVNKVRLINMRAGRSLIIIKYPEDVRP